MKFKTYYYSDPLNDDFAGTNIDTKLTPEDYVYIPRSFVFRIFAFIMYRIIARPVTYLFDKIVHHHKYENKKVIKEVGKSGCFFYGNHTLLAGDAFIPNHMALRKNYIVAGPDAISIPGIRTIVKMLGALPVPSTIRGAKNYTDAVTELIGKGKSVTVYPETHIWPYYTKIRPFKNDSFSLPVALDAPCFSFTNVYFKSKNPLIRRPVVKTYVNGPFYPDKSLPKRERIAELRDRVYESMVRESEKQEQYLTNVFVEKQKKKEP